MTAISVIFLILVEMCIVHINTESFVHIFITPSLFDYLLYTAQVSLLCHIN